MKIGFISDTHGVLRDEVIALLKDCQMIFHSGDIGGSGLLNRLEAIAQVLVVRGNNDREPWAQKLPRDLFVSIHGIDFYMVHDRKDIPEGIAPQVIVYGHSHQYRQEQIGDTLYLNPGACGRRRFSLPLTLAIGQLEEGELRIRKHIIN